MPAGGFDVIVSNPPYISREEFEILPREVKEYEPMTATTDGKDGLTFFSRLAGVGRQSLVKGGWLCLEVAYNQATTVGRMLEAAGFGAIGETPDYNRILRVVTAQQMA